jgi:two-component system, chemotaxis family, response regulator Rcp1
MSNEINTRSNWLMIEDNPGDVLLVKMGLKKIGLLLDLCIAEDGDKAIKILRKEGEFSSTPLPEMILLDLNLPKRDGIEVLSEIRNNPVLQDIPVIVFSSSGSPRDKERCGSLRVDRFITKPGKLTDYINAIEEIQSFWLDFKNKSGNTEDIAPSNS